jgi:membrane-bound lytic murein transglycosylase C
MIGTVCGVERRSVSIGQRSCEIMPVVMRRSVILWGLCLIASPSNAHHLGVEHSPPAAATPSQQQQREARYQRQREKIREAYSEYRKKVSRVWGAETVVPDAKRDVTYRDNLTQRSIVDYEAGLVKVELVVPPAKAEDTQAVKAALASAVTQTLQQGPDDRPITEVATNPAPPPAQLPPVLAGLVAKEDGSPLTEADLEDFKTAKVRAMQMRALRGEDGKERIIFSTHFKMVPEHIRVLAEKYRDSVERYARQHIIPTALIYAIIETESAFNPRAKSPIPAFGLMQLVPETGAREAFKFLYDKDQVVKERHLYVPDKNIELGTAYLHILYHRYFRAIKDPQSRLWATIAAYNTGPRNVIKTFSGKYTRKRFSSSYVWKRHAINKINRMGPKRVYVYLRKHLPDGETRRYLKKVRTRLPKYGADNA